MGTRILILLVVMAAGLWQVSGARISEQVPVGPRALAMGGAYSALADDASAMFWNPAGLAELGHQEVTASYANLYNTGIKDNLVAFVLPVREGRVVGADWYHSGFDDDELTFGENRFDLSFGMRLHSQICVGATAKYLIRTIDLDGTSVRDGSGAGFDLGMLLTPLPRLRLAVVGQDVTDTELEYSGEVNTAAPVYPYNVRFAAAYDLKRYATAALDIDDRFHLGAEVRPADPVALRGGVQLDRSGEMDPVWSFGAGFKLGVLRVDYAYEIHPALDATSHFGLSLAFNFNPARMRIEKVEVDEIFPSLYKMYAMEPMGRLKIHNLQDEPLEARISTYVPRLMDAPTEQSVTLRPHATEEIPLTAVFSEDILTLTGDQPVQVKVAATYQSQRLPRTDERTVRAVAYAPGAIDWSRGVAQAAAFVTPLDPAVDEFAQAAVRGAVDATDDPLNNRNLRYAAALFDALGLIGMSYVPDPNNPFSRISETPRAVDTVHYPRETLVRRSGDCDDTAVLMAALLANVGIASQFVDVPGHVLLLVDTGLHVRHQLGLALGEEFSVVADDGVWIPLETTAIKQGFAEAWKQGAAEYQNGKLRGTVKLVDVTEAQSRYVPSVPRGEFAKVMQPAADELRGRTTREAQEIHAWREEYLSARYGRLPENGAPSETALNELALVFYRAGDFSRATDELTGILERHPESARALNNLGVVRVASGDGAQGMTYFESAQRADPEDPGIWLNIGIVRHLAGDSLSAKQALREGLQRSGGLSEALSLLGVRPGGTLREKAAAALSEEEIQRLLLNSLAEVPAAADSADTSTAASPRIEEPARAPGEVRIAATRAIDAQSLQGHLYWKD